MFKLPPNRNKENIVTHAHSPIIYVDINTSSSSGYGDSNKCCWKKLMREETDHEKLIFIHSLIDMCEHSYI